MMKKVTLMLVLGLIVFMGCSKKEQSDFDQSWTNIQKSGKLVLGFDDAFPPMGFKSENGYTGFDIEVAESVAKRLNIALELQPIVWDMKDQELKTKKIDCIWNGFAMTTERIAAFTFSKPYLSNTQTVVVLSDSPIYKLTDLKGKRLALQRDSSALDALNNFPQVKSDLKALLEFENYVMAMTELDTGNSDAVLVGNVLAEYGYISKNPGKYRILEESLTGETYGIGFRKGDIALKDKIDATLVDMANDGTLAKISTKWFGKDLTIIK